MKRIVQFITLILTSIALMVVVSYAWFINAEFVDPQISGYSESAYFGGGDGTDERPYIIKNPRHLYNLAWLQYLGYFNVPIDSNGNCTSTDSNYFGHGKNYSAYQHTENGSKVTMTQYSFVITNPNLDMTGWVLPPIGTNEQPFVGKLVGSANGTGGTVEISNLLTTNNFKEFGNKHPGNVTEESRYVSGTGNSARLNFANVIGFIGAIGMTDTLNRDLGATEAAMANSGVTISSTANALYNITLKATTVKTETSKALIGAVAGYVNGTIANVGVRRPTLNVLSSQSLSGNTNVNISDYTVAGYATNDYTTAKTKRATTVFNPTYSYDRFNFTGMGTADEWGGSMNFADMYTRFRNAKESTYNNTNGQGKHFDYVYREIIRSDGSIKQDTQDSGNNDLSTYFTRRYKEDSKPENGVYLTWARTSSTTETNDSAYNYQPFNYVIGLYKDVYKITRNGNAITGYKIHDGNGNYLTYVSSTNTFSNTNLSNDATIWIFEDNEIYTYNEEVYSTDIKRCLNGTTDLIENLSSSSTTSWNWDNTNNSFYYSFDNNTYYLKYFNGQWTTKPTYAISDGNGNYLAINSNNQISNVTSLSDATPLMFEDSINMKGRIYTKDGVYLRYNNGLTADTTSTNWLNDGYGPYYSGNYIQFNGTNWVATRPLNFYIVFNNGSTTNYLTGSGTTISNQTNVNNATLWTFETNNGNPSGRISYVYNNQTYYLRNNNGTPQLTNSQNNATSWSNDGSGLYNGNYYLQYINGSWTLSNTRYYYISYNYNGVIHYLSQSSNSLSDTTSKANAQLWTFSTSGTYPSGTISYRSGNTTYYLRNNSGTLQINTTNSNNSWTNTNGILSNDTYYLQFDNNISSKWCLKPQGYKISYNGNYLNASGTSGVTGGTDANNAAIWYVDTNNRIYTFINNNKYYFYYSDWSSGTFGITTSTSQSYYLGKNNNTLRALSSNGNWSSYYAYYSGGWKETSSSKNLTWTPIANFHTIDTELTWCKLSPNINVSFTEKNNLSLSRTSSSTYHLQSTLSAHKPSVSSYVPLNTTKNNNNITFNVDNKNTGYIIGGSNESSGQYADYRVSQYALSNISSSYSSKSWVNNSILTVGSNGYGTSKYVGSTSYPESNFTKYTNSKDILKGVLDGNSSNVYGLHFMDASISMDNIIVAPKVVINNKTYTNYEMPEDCIDFRLASNGIINFFAGCYYPGNNSFFSLHEIIRDDTDANNDGIPDNPVILGIKHITKIYKANSTYGNGWKSADCIYQYEGGTWSGENVSSNSKYDLVFDSTWIENPESLGGGQLSATYNNYDQITAYNLSRYLFYFEIPVNKGEFALGSVVGGTGAYLIYLDIGANAAPVDRTEIQQKQVTISSDYKFVNGIQIIGDNQSISTYTDIASNSAVAVIPAGNTIASLSIVRTDDTIAITGATLDSSYSGENITLTGATLKALVERTTTRQVLMYIDYNLSRDKLYHSTVTKQDVNTACNNILTKYTGTSSHPNATYNYVIEEIDPTTGAKITTGNKLPIDIDKSLIDESYDYGLLQITTNAANTRVGTKVNASDLSGVITTPGNNSILGYKMFTTTVQTDNPFRGVTEVIDMNVAKITTQKNIPNANDPSHPYQVNNNGELTITDTLNNEYVLSYVYELTGNAITITLANGTVITVDGSGNTYIIQDGLIIILTKYDNYSFTINGTTVTAVNQQITVNAT